MTFEEAIANYRTCATTLIEMRDAERDAERLLAQGEAVLWASEAVQVGTNDKQRKALFEAACVADAYHGEHKEAAQVARSSVVFAELEAQIAELRARLPRHTAPPAMLVQLDELEEALEDARRAAAEEAADTKADSSGGL